MTVETHRFADDGRIPNSKLPLLVYRACFSRSDLAAAFERRFAANDWRGALARRDLRLSSLPQHQPRGAGHRARRGAWCGSAAKRGETLRAAAGDVVVIPAGRRAPAGVAARTRPPGGRRLSRGPGVGRPARRSGRAGGGLANLAAVPLPTMDPVDGADGPSARRWIGKGDPRPFAIPSRGRATLPDTLPVPAGGLADQRCRCDGAPAGDRDRSRSGTGRGYRGPARASATGAMLVSPFRLRSSTRHRSALAELGDRSRATVPNGPTTTQPRDCSVASRSSARSASSSTTSTRTLQAHDHAPHPCNSPLDIELIVLGQFEDDPHSILCQPPLHRSVPFMLDLSPQQLGAEALTVLARPRRSAAFTPAENERGLPVTTLDAPSHRDSCRLARTAHRA